MKRRASQDPRWAWRLGSIRGIDIRLHASFFLLLLWVGFSFWAAGLGARGVVEGLALIIALFGCVVLHELGHALVAQRYGIRTRDITLWPIGGVARLERLPEEPRQEMWVALAGPAVNVVIAGLLLAILAATGSLVPFEQVGLTAGPLLQRLMALNVVLAVFNMVPAFPMDGGRVLRAVLAHLWGHAEGTRVAAAVGKALAVGFAILGLFGSPILLFIGVFVWLAATQELLQVRIKSMTAGARARDVMVRNFEVLEPGAPLGHALERLIAGTQEDFPVVVDGQILGVLVEPDLMAGLERHGEQGLVSQVMRTDVTTIDALAPLSEALAQLQSTDVPILVTHHVALVGIITRRNLAEFVTARDALESHARGEETSGSPPLLASP